MPRQPGKATLAARLETHITQKRLDFRARHHCTQCGLSLNDFHPYDDYMLTAATWARVHPEGVKGFLCHTCLYDRVGTTLTRADLTGCLAYVNRTALGITPALQARLEHIAEFQRIATKQAAYVREHWLPALPLVFAHLTQA